MSRMKDLFGDQPYSPREAYQLVRDTDPDTSYEAAEKILPKLRDLQQHVYDRLHAAGRHGLTDYELEQSFSDHGSTYRTRRAELTDKKLGLVAWTGEYRIIHGRRRKVWALSEFLV